MKKIFLILLVFFGCYSPSLSFGGPAATTDLLGSAMTQGEIVDLAIKYAGLEFFLPKNTENWDKAKLFEMKKTLLFKARYPVFEKAKIDEPVDCTFLAEVAYQISTPLEKREDISCQGAIKELQGKSYKIDCACGEGVDGVTAASLFNDPQFLQEVLAAANPVALSPYATALSEAYSTPASSPVR
jgi:hypothetical protein